MNKKTLSAFVLAMMNVAIIMSLRGLPLMAKEGTTLIFYLLFSIIIFLIPTALISAELATAWPEGGGVYRWVKVAFGDHLGFVAIWLQWIQNVIWYPTILAFAAGTLSYLFLDPSLAQNKLYNVLVILGIYWGATLINFQGVKTSGWLTTLAVIIGTIIPGLLIILLALLWVIKGNPIAFSDQRSFFPDLTRFSQISFLAGIVLLFAGMEVSAVHANEVKDPKKDYPKAILLASVIIFVVFLFGALSIGTVIPAKEITLTAGLMQAFKNILDSFNIGFLLPLMGLLVAFGSLGGVTAWIIGPSKGLYNTAKNGDIPPFLAKTNSKGVPITILIIQGIIVTVLTLLYLFMPTVSSAFFLLTDLTAILYLLMYLLLFSSGIYLRYKQPNVERAYKIPGGNVGMWITGAIGIIGTIFAIIVGLVPPAKLSIGNPVFYVLFLVIGIGIFTIAPIIIICFRKPSWKLKNSGDKP